MTCRLFALSAVVAAALMSAAPAALRQPRGGASSSNPAQAPARSIDSVLDALDRVRAFHETAISPDGRRVAWVEDLSAADETTAIYLRTIGAAATDTHRVTASNDGRGHREGGIAWAPDNHTLAFLSDNGSPAQQQLYVLDVDGGGPARRVTEVKGQLAQPRWSSDGRQIAVLFVAGSTQATGALVAYKPDAGVVGDVVEEQRIAVVDLASGAVREVSPANMFVYDYDWSPDGTAFAAEAVEGSGTNNYWIAQLYVVRADTGATTSIWKPPLQIAGPRWSPDGRSIAVIHGIMSDEGATGGDIYVVPAAGGAAKNITPNLEGSARALAWRADGRIVFNEYVDGKSALVTVGSTGGARSTLWSAPQQVTYASVASRVESAAAVVQSFQQAPEVYAGPLGRWTAQTSTNASVAPLWGEAKSLHWTSDAFRVQGWLLYPADFDPARTYPLIVSVHGGPSSANVPSWPVRWNAVLPSRGYFVLLPNPRGSYGGGEAFTQANVNDFGYGDLRDIEAGVDAAMKVAPIDPRRTGIIGWSYGGYMTMWAVTQTTRFTAAVAGAGIANWQSYYGQNKIDTWMLPFFGASVYDKPEAYARSSPITYIKKVKTPTLVLHGDRDSEVPTPQGYEFWHALKALGVPTELVIYPDEGHAIVKPEHQRDIERRLVAWFDRYLQQRRSVSAAANQPRMNLNGSWDLDKAATRLQLLDVANLERGTLRIEQSDTELHFTRVFAMGGGENTFSYDLPLDGGEVVTEASGETRYSHLAWADDALVYSARIVAAGGESTNVVRYRLSSEGNTLEAHEQRRGVDNYDNLWVFRRRQ